MIDFQGPDQEEALGFTIDLCSVQRYSALLSGFPSLCLTRIRPNITLFDTYLLTGRITLFQVHRQANNQKIPLKNSDFPLRRECLYFLFVNQLHSLPIRRLKASKTD